MQLTKKPEHIHHHSLITQLKQAICGGLAGCVTRFVTQPFDVLKIRFQMQVEPVKRHSKDISKYTSMPQAFRTVYTEEGLQGLWRGHNAGQVLSITYALMQFWSYEQLKQYSKKFPMFHNSEALMYFMCGGAAGCLGVLVSQPFDTIRTRVVASDKHSKSNTMGAFRGAFEILKKEGIAPLFRGMTFTMVQIYPLVGANFLFYKYLNKVDVALQRKFDRSTEPTNKFVSGYKLFVNGAIAGTIAKAIVYPMDLLKKRLQLSNFNMDRTTFGKDASCLNLRQCVRQTYQMEGFHGFFKGMAPTLWKSGVTTAVYFGVYDNLRDFSKQHSQETKETKYEAT